MCLNFTAIVIYIKKQTYYFPKDDYISLLSHVSYKFSLCDVSWFNNMETIIIWVFLPHDQIS